jgi:hypothetical protein
MADEKHLRENTSNPKDRRNDHLKADHFRTIHKHSDSIAAATYHRPDCKSQQ